MFVKAEEECAVSLVDSGSLLLVKIEALQFCSASLQPMNGILMRYLVYDCYRPTLYHPEFPITLIGLHLTVLFFIQLDDIAVTREARRADPAMMIELLFRHADLPVSANMDFLYLQHWLPPFHDYGQPNWSFCQFPESQAAPLHNPGIQMWLKYYIGLPILLWFLITHHWRADVPIVAPMAPHSATLGQNPLSVPLQNVSTLITLLDT
uniref:Uncharacterized protein n=1 Tax=Cucumis melo TaxID=3656 RepID=A0A9I9E505_CUCME